MAAATTTEPAFTGTIARVNGRGFTTREQPSTWFNLSRFATPTPTIPPVGTDVRITVDGDGYVRTVEPLSAPATNGTNHQPATPTSNDTGIVRMAALETDVRISEPGTPADALLRLAGQFEAWIVR